MTATLLIAIVLGCRIVAGDLFERRIPNRWLLAALLGGLACHLAAAVAGDTGAAGRALLGLAIGVAVLLPFHLLGWMGAGDVKYFGVIGLLLGPQALPAVWVVASLIAGGHAALLLAGRLRVLRWLHPLRTDAETPLSAASHRPGRVRTRGIPYAAYLSVGVFAWIVVHLGGLHG
ncbi:A24 family peptidase [Luteimonas abyssi]|uniref:A24 family peptidase n=1 Tax=Luteimonas abyssi TaxID=1247514 RepID=UPI000737BB0D|nr:prepilin peptidase [Luteimonas abyssi]